MINQIQLTGARQTMNMVKLGTVSRSLKISASLGNPRQQRAVDLLWYTLCVIDVAEKRNSSRNGCGFDILPISGRAFGSPSLKSPGSVVIPGLTAMGGSHSVPRINTGLQRRDFLSLGRNYSTFVADNSLRKPTQTRAAADLARYFLAKSKLFRLCPILGGCHE
jgi:hypothetical protein